MTHKLIESPETGEVFFADFERGVICSIDGTPFTATQQHKSWPDVTKSEPPYLFAWQADPGTFGPHYILARMMPADGMAFTMGGSVLRVMPWAEEHNAKATLLKCYSDRNVARRAADVER